MYKIYINEVLVQTTPVPCYVYYDSKISSFRTCDENMAEAVYITEQKGEEQEYYYADIDNKQYRHDGFELVSIQKVDD